MRGAAGSGGGGGQLGCVVGRAHYQQHLQLIWVVQLTNHPEMN